MRTRKEFLTDMSIYFAIGLLAFILGYFLNQQFALERSLEVMSRAGQTYDCYDLTYIAIGETPE